MCACGRNRDAMAQGNDDNFIRSLQRLYDSRSTSRVFNIARLHADLAASGQPVEKALFANRSLNKSIITKHRLRRGEEQMFLDRRFSATKIMILIDVKSLKVRRHNIARMLTLIGEKKKGSNA